MLIYGMNMIFLSPECLLKNKQTTTTTIIFNYLGPNSSINSKSRAKVAYLLMAMLPNEVYLMEKEKEKK